MLSKWWLHYNKASFSVEFRTKTITRKLFPSILNTKCRLCITVMMNEINDQQLIPIARNCKNCRYSSGTSFATNIGKSISKIYRINKPAKL